MRHMMPLLAIAVLCGVDNASFAGPVCSIEDQAHCQSAATGQFILQSDRLSGIRRADDFRPAATVIHQICYFPCFLGVTASGQSFECAGGTLGGTPPPDNFVARFYEDDFGKPGVLVPGIPADGLNLVVESKAHVSTGSRCWRYTSPILSPTGLAVTAGECMWIEVTGLGEAQANGVCEVYSLSSADGNQYSMRDENDSYQLSDFDRKDLAFCIDGGIIGASNPPVSLDGGCGDFPVACCKPGPSCVDGGTYSECVGSNPVQFAGLPFPYITCAELAVMGGCPIPPNDECADAYVPIECANQVPNPDLGVCSVSEGPPNIMEVCDTTLGAAPRHDCPNPSATCGPLPPNFGAYRCQFTTDNRLASTDGPNTFGGAQPTCTGNGGNSFKADVWYKYIAPCNGYITIHSCGPNKTYDLMLQIFSVDSPSCVACPPTSNQSKGCSDDNCGTSASGAALRLPVADDVCYTIRVGGYSQLGNSAGASQNLSGLDLGVVCTIPEPAPLPLPAPPPHDRRKNRYISFRPDDTGQVVAYRVRRSNTSSYCWVKLPMQSGADLYTATCGSGPVYRVWTEPVVHVGDCEIIPVADYTIYANLPGGWENPNGLSVSTILAPSINSKLWGDNVGMNNGIEWTAPDQLANVNDVLSLLAFIGNQTIRPHFTVANLQSVSSVDSCLNAQVNTSDVLIAVRAVAGDSYGMPATSKITSFSQCAWSPSANCPCCGN